MKFCHKTTLDDIKSHVLTLVPPEMFQWPRARLAHIPRYLKAVQLRLSRLPNDSRKDEQKALQIKPFWAPYLQCREKIKARDPEGIDEFRWLVIEWRVSVFAPELKTPFTVSQKKLEERWRVLCR